MQKNRSPFHRRGQIIRQANRHLTELSQHTSPSVKRGRFTKNCIPAFIQVFYLCRGEVRQRELLKLANEVSPFVQRSLAAEQKTRVFSLENNNSFEGRVILKFYLGRTEDEKDH
jgi:hypothetical protein